MITGNILLGNIYGKQAIREMLSSEALQNDFKIVKSPGDGLCLSVSMCVSLKAQFPYICDFNVTKLIKLLKEEAIQYQEIYSIAIKSPGALEYQMYVYINNKNYDSDFGDIVPLLLANSIAIDVCILYRHECVMKHNLVACKRSIAKSCVFIYKCDEHYDAVSPVSPITCSHDPSPDEIRNVQCPQLSKQAQADKIVVNDVTEFNIGNDQNYNHMQNSNPNNVKNIARDCLYGLTQWSNTN